MQRDIDILWVVVSSGLVFIMQAGFLTLEAGLTRSKNNINVSMKVLADFAIATCVFWIFGYAFMFGTTTGGVIGVSEFAPGFDPANVRLIAFLLFQVMFCGTSVTIISGAIAERVKFSGFLIVAVFAAGIVYPIFGHWAWNGINDALKSGWLGASGFVDFAGSTVVHSVGGWISLAILLVVGARSGRFPANESPRKIPGANMPLAALGVLILWFGWIGFNGGSTLALNNEVVRIVFNTFLAGAFGLVSALVWGMIRYGRADASAMMNGTLAGLVAITANCFAVSQISAVLIGIGGTAAMLFVEYLLERFRVDDAVGAIPVHLGAGIWGTLAVGIFGQPELLATGLSRIAQIGVQALGIVAAGIWAFGLTYIVFRIINNIRPLRVSADDEQIGLNVSEHGATTEILDLFTMMDTQSRTGDFSLRAPVEPFTEIGQIADKYNQVLNALEFATARTDAIVKTAIDGIITFTKGSLQITSMNPAGGMMFGYDPMAILGEPLTLLLGVPEGLGVGLEPEQIDRIFTKGLKVSNRFDLVGVRSSGSSFPMEVIISETNVGDEVFYTGWFHAQPGA
jgi:Amt family ammonium transporter